MRPLTRGTPRSQGAHTALTAPPKSLPSGLKLHQKKQWSDKEIVLVAMVGQANHCIQQHVALAQLPLGAHRGVPDDGAFYQERGQALRRATHADILKHPCTTSRMCQAYCQGTPSVWCRVLGRIPAGGQWPYFMRGASRGIPTTKLHSMYSRMLAAGAAVGAGHSNLQQPGQPCIIPQHGNMRKTFFYRCASVDTPNKLWPNHRADCNM